jgi:hypothetical protein
MGLGLSDVINTVSESKMLMIFDWDWPAITTSIYVDILELLTGDGDRKE